MELFVSHPIKDKTRTPMSAQGNRSSKLSPHPDIREQLRCYNNSLLFVLIAEPAAKAFSTTHLTGLTENLN